MKKVLSLSGRSLYPAPAQPATGRQGGPRLGLPNRFHRERSRQVEARRFSTRFASSGALGQAWAAGVAKATSGPERRRQRRMPAQGLGCQMLRRELTALGNENHNPARFGFGGTQAGEAGRTAFMEYPG